MSRDDDGTTAPNGKQYESVWDFPRPPRLESVPWRIRVIHRERTVAEAPYALRVLETSQPPAYYIAPEFVDLQLLEPSETTTYCEWKGWASYADVVVDGHRAADAAWRYDRPSQGYRGLEGCYAFYAQRLDQCLVDDELVLANEGGFYGGWITANVIGPFKGGPGTSHW